MNNKKEGDRGKIQSYPYQSGRWVWEERQNEKESQNR